MTKRKSITWQVELLTPLHIGDGEELQENFDFIHTKNSLQVIDLENLLDSLAEEPDIVREIGRNGFNLKNFIKQFKLTPQVFYNLSCQGWPTSVRRFLKDGRGRPYLAGSSLKGALRTAILATLDRSRLPSPDTVHKKDFAKAVRNLDGHDAHHKITRMLQVSDSIPLLPDESLGVAEIRFFNLGFDCKPLWKDFSSRKNKKAFQDAKGIFVEIVKPGKTFTIQMAVDSFLLDKNVRKASGIQSCSPLNSPAGLCRAVNRHSMNIAELEENFFRKYKQNNVADFYTRLKRKIEDISESENCCIVRLAWGSGWIGMTGGWLTGRALDAVRGKNNLGKKGHQVFPKTRRLAMKDGVPVLPLGWVKIISVKDDGMFSLAGSKGADPRADNTPPNTPEDINTIKTVDPAEVREENLKLFISSLPSPSDFPAQSDTFISNVKGMEDKKLRQRCCREILLLLKKLPKKKKLGKQIKNEKKWALSLQSLCQDNGVDIST